jgi:hypothetical protein
MAGAAAWDVAVTEMRRSLRELAAVPSRASRQASDEITELLHEEFAAGLDPYGEPWAKLRPATVAKKGGRTQILVDTELAQDTTVARPMAGSGIAVETDQPALAFSQSGTERQVRREVFPDNRGLPQTWDHAIEAAIDQAMGRALQ